MSSKKYIAGSIQIVDGTQGDGKVLVSDSNGLATWSNISGGGTVSEVTSGVYSIGTTIFTNNIGGTFSVDGYYAPYELKNYSGSTFGEKLQMAIDSVPSGVTIDCNDTEGISLQIDISIDITKPVTILLGDNLITANVGLGNNVFNILSSSVMIKGVSSSAKSSDLGGRTRITMSSGSWHIYSVGYNLLRFEDFDLIGVRSTEYRYDSGTTSLKTAPYSFNNDGSGGVFVAEGDPYVVGGGNTVSKLVLQNLFIYQTMNSGILILGGITSRIENCRISSAAGHGIYIGSSTTTMTLINNYVSSAFLAGICLDGVATSVLISNATEYAGIGLWLKSCQSVEVVGHYSEACGTRDTTRMPDNTGYFINNSLGGQYISDIGTDNLTIFKGTSYVITGGRNIYLPNPYSNNPGIPNAIGASTTTRHILIRGSIREIYLLNPRCTSSVGYAGTPRFDIGIETLNTDIPRDVNLFFNPSLDGTITPTIAGKYITQTNSSGESTVVLDQGSNTRIQSGANIWSYDTVLRTVITGTTYTTLPNDRMIVVSSLTASIAVTLLTPPSGSNVIYTFNDESGSASLSKKIILSAQSSKTIDGVSSFDLITTPYGYGSVYYNGTNWNVLDKTHISTIDITYADLYFGLTSSTLVKDATYYITDKKIWLKALENNLLSESGLRKLTIIKHNAYYGTGTLGVWHNSLTPSIGNKVIWGGRLWSNVTGNVGSKDDDMTLDGTNWSLIISDSIYYDKIFDVGYEFSSNKVNFTKDNRGNIIYFGDNYGDRAEYCDWGNKNIYGNTATFIANNVIDYIYNNKGSLYNSEIKENICNEIYENIFETEIRNNNGNTTKIYNNINCRGISVNDGYDAIYENIGTVIYGNTGSGFIRNNIGDEISNNSTNSLIDNKVDVITYNTVSVIRRNIGYLIQDNLAANGIDNNKCEIIRYNNSNVTSINNNICDSITNNSNIGHISSNLITSSIRYNSGTGSIQFNTNNGQIGWNTTSDIQYNTNNGDIMYNGINGIIHNNSNNGAIDSNSQTSGTCSITNNNNNGNITGARTSDVIGTIVNI